METQIEKHWYPLYTKSRHEKKAYDNLVKAGYETFLPLKKSVRKWQDRKKVVEMPLISSYIFARINFSQMQDALNVYGVTRYISFNGKPAFVRDEEIEILKKVMSEGTEIQAIDGAIAVGSRVKIISGAFAGYSGKVSSRTAKKKLFVELEAMNKTLMITLEQDTEFLKES